MDNILSSVYFGNIHYFSKLVGDSGCIIDPNENYCKQTYRNRCDIVGANGVLTLSVPTVKVHNRKTAMKDIEIDYATDWQKQHLRSIVSAYKNSPYFDYYFHKIEPFFQNKEKFLLNLNIKTVQVVLDIIGIDKKVEYSTQYIDSSMGNINDYRDIISPKGKIEDSGYTNIEYYQVFSEKMEFNPNMSILDLIFCEGRGAKEILKQSNIMVE